MGGGFHVSGGGMPKKCRKLDIFLTFSRNYRRFWEKLGQMLRNLVIFWKMGENIQIFLENRGKIQIFGASRRHIRGSQRLVGGDPPPPKSSFWHLWGGIPPHQFQILWGGILSFMGGDLSNFCFLGGDPPHPPPVGKTLCAGINIFASLVNLVFFYSCIKIHNINII